MKCDPYEVLRKVVRIANSTALEFPAGFQAILRFLARRLELEEIHLLLLDSRQKSFSFQIDPHGPGRHLENGASRPASPLEKTALASRKPAFGEGRASFPLCNPQRNYGVLNLAVPPGAGLAQELSELLGAVCAQLAMLAQHAVLKAESGRRVRQLTLLSDLGQQLNQARTLRELLPAAVRTLLRRSGAACVVLRPLIGETVLGRSFVRTHPDFRTLRPLFLDLEEEASARALGVMTTVFRQGLPRSGQLQGPLPPAMVAIPLLFQERAVGTLTLFGGDQGGVPVVYDREAKRLFAAIGAKVAQALERVSSRERLELLSVENDRKFREAQLLYRISRAVHSTLRLNEVVHLILSAATIPEGGGFGRAMLFTINERTGTLQGMLGVSRETASLLLPAEGGQLPWARPVINDATLDAQRQAPFCRQVMKQRLALDDADNSLARSAREGRVVLVRETGQATASDRLLADAMGVSCLACAPLRGKERTLGVLVVDNAQPGEEISSDRLRFLELFANQAGAAIENSMLLHRLETTHQELRHAQDRLTQGEKMAALGEMAASVAHELRNPLVSIGGFAKRLARIAPEQSREQEYAAIIAREALRMEVLLTDVLDFSKKQMLCFAQCSIPAIIDKALALEADALTRSLIRVEREIEAELPLVQADEEKLLQVLINLVTNARQVMAHGGGLLVKAYSTILRGEPAVTLEVADTGGGIKPEILRSIFEPFFTTKTKGTGLGLPISHRIVEQHQGKIEVRNNELGAVFLVCLPVSGPVVPFR
ncbi:hypothetical protein DESUT3_37340 [Desulfuromonas versatilis]|uniref:histidine kinase n=1 Tax=Desulfuromonas versatilis TaxID=2802975 RepID=A0ABN6E2T9_9BACT|nr:ATP-binding protein [Desulfuromonas versatilis]BCR06665.1 hypothetical protein DESUT3_37340 [Desulfuromonas versatilis]